MSAAFVASCFVVLAFCGMGSLNNEGPNRKMSKVQCVFSKRAQGFKAQGACAGIPLAVSAFPGKLQCV